MGAAHLSRGATGKREIADRKRMGAARLRMPAAIAKRVELLHIAELDAGLPFHPLSQADFECAMLSRLERAKRQGVLDPFPAMPGRTTRMCGC